MATKDDTHWVLVWDGDGTRDCIEYSSRRTAMRGAARAARHWEFVAVVAENDDTLEVYEESWSYGDKIPTMAYDDAKAILKVWNTYWRVKETQQ